MDKKYIVILLMICFAKVSAQSPSQNCMGAIPICQNVYYQGSSYAGVGTVNELNGSNQGCLTTGENNSVWYIFNTATAGSLVFTITPSSPLNVDYDFAVWDLTDKSCSAIASGLPPIRCNYASYANSTPGGLTGLSTSSTNPSIGANGPSFSSAINASSGETYLILINNSSASTSGYTIDFTGSTSQILDNISPTIKSDTILASCSGPLSIKVLLSENVTCSSFASNGSDFSLSPATASISSASSASCSSGGIYTNLFTLNFSSPLSPGNYTLSIVNGTDGNTLIDNCGNAMAVGTSINFTVVPSLQASVTTQFGCAGTPSGAITVSNIGGTSPFTYKLNSGAFTSNNVFSGLFAGTYTITIKDANGCTDDTIVNLVQGPAINILSAIVTNLNCYGVNTGSVTITANGGTPPLSYAIGSSAYASSNVISNLGPGNYFIHVKDANGCIKDTLIFISSPGQITINSLSLTNSNCAGNNGTIQVNAFGGILPLTFALNAGAYQTSGNFSSLSPGSYIVHVKDANNCLKDTIVIIQQINPPFINSLLLTPASCAGNSGSISLSGSGGALPYSYSINGVTFTTASTFTNLSSGTYTVIIKDATGCTASSSAVLSSPSNLYFLNATVVNPTCLQQGSITVNGIGGLAPYQFALGSGVYTSSNTFISLVPGSYLVHIKDNNGCVHDTNLTLANTLIPTINSLTTVNPSCSFSSVGSISINASGGTSPLTYSLNGGLFLSSNSFNGLSGGNYTVTVKDANGCTSSTVTTLSTLNTVSFTSFSHINVGCLGSPLGSISSILGNGNPPYQYNINGGVFGSSGNFTSLAAGTYTVIGKDASGCTKSSVVVISSSAIMTINSIAITNSICNNPPSGSININGTVSATPISYSLNFGTASSSGLFTPLVIGTYTVSIKDANGCHKDSVVNISGPAPMYFTNPVIVYPPCYGGLGSISIQGAGGIPPYTFSLDSNPYSSSSNWPSLGAGTYTIHLKDASGCIHDTIIDLIQPPPINFTSVVLSNSSCSGAFTGSIIVSATSGNPPFQYALNSGPFSPNSTFTGLGPGVYVIHAMDAAGCAKDSVVTLNNTGNFFISSILKTLPTCFAGNNGSISLLAGGGTSPYQYALNAGTYATSNNFTGLASGNYTLHAKDNGGCVKDTVVFLSQPSQLNFSSLQKTAVTCNGLSNGTASVQGMGGTAPYQYKIDGGTYGSISSFNNLSVGLHTISIKDLNACTKDTIFSITQPNNLYFTNVTIVNPGCLGTVGVINVAGTGGVGPYTYSIGTSAYTTSGSFNNLPVGTYTLHVKDNNACVHDTIITIVNSQLITLNLLSASVFLCQNSTSGFINANAISLYPPVNYSYNGGVPQTSGLFSGLSAGTYSVHIEDQIGCFLDSVITMQSAPPILINNVLMTSTNCHSSNDGIISINAIGGLGSLKYAINSGAYSSNNTFTNLGAGTYTLHIKDSISCIKDSIVILTSPSAIYFSSINLVYPYCSNATDGQITINATGGAPPYIYAINTSLFTTNNNFQNLFQGTYTVHVKDYNGCMHDTIIQLVANNYMDFTNVVISNVSCKYGNDGSISLGVLGGTSPYNFTINSVATGSTSYFGNLGAGAYTINVIDNLGCQADTVIVVTEPANAIVANIIQITPNLCRGDSIGTITAGGLGGSPSYQYAIDGSPFQVSPLFTGLSAGNYLISIKDANGCMDDTLVTVIEPDTSVQLFLIGIKDQSCIGVNDGAITVTSKYGYNPVSYYLNSTLVGTDTFYNNLAPNNYIVEVKDSLGCKSTGKFVVQPSDRRPYILIDSIHGILCEGDLDGAIDWHTINTFPPYYYTFDSLYLGTTSFMNNLTNGTYYIQVVDSVGCKADTTVTIVEGDKMNLTVQATPALCQGLGDDGKAIALVEGGVNPFSYRWSGQAGNYTDQATNLWYGEQIAYVTDALGCTDTSHFVVDYDPCCLVNLPNAFTPNGDGKNDIFKVIKYGISTILSFEVYNRWGNRVFWTNSETDGWDGKFQGVDSDLGTYFYILRYRCHLKNEDIMLKGDVTLLR